MLALAAASSAPNAALPAVHSAAGDAHAGAEGAANALSGWISGAIAAPELSWAGWILGLPALAAIVCWVCAALRVKNKLPAIVTVAALGGAFGLTLALYFSYTGHYHSPVTVHLYDWMRFGWTAEGGSGAAFGSAEAFIADFGLYIDGLTLFWMLFVTGLGTLIALYASEYMESDVGGDYCRFFGSVSIFLLSMGCLVMGGNLALLYLGWEGVGVASYLLIGYYYGKPTAVAAAKKAFVMNRIGDLGLLVGIFLVWRHFGSIDFATIFKAVSQPVAADAHWSMGLIPFFLMLGAFGKSAQIPLFTWLPDAMEGPTPVSALIHAATMVTAGVYLIARMYPFFLLHPDALHTVAWIGGMTAFVAATIGLLQYDMKRVFAYSTVSQLGFMFLGLGVGTTFGAGYHVFTHAFFKALLFLASGAVMHGFAGQLDIRKISGLRNVPGFKIVSWTMFVGCLWLAAFPFSAGFFSKDEILYVAMTDPVHGSPVLAWIGLFTAFLTAYYTFRVWFRVCAGPVAFQPGEESHGHFHPHPPRVAINGVLAVLAIGAVLAGVPAYIAFFGGENWAEHMIGMSSAAQGVPSLGTSAAEHAGSAAHPTILGFDGHIAMFALSTIAGLAGLSLAWYFHLANRKAADSLKQSLLANPLVGWLPRALENKWYVDEIYDALFRKPMWAIGYVFAFVDKHLVDGTLVLGSGRLTAGLGRVFQPLYNGVLQGYAVTMAGGLGLILAWIVWAWMGGGGT